MIYLYICLCELLFICWSYLFWKTYQLSSYKPSEFMTAILNLNLSFGSKNKLVLTKRMVRFIITYLLVAFLLFFLIFYFIGNVFLLLFDVCVIFLFEPIVLLLTHYLVLPLEWLIQRYYICRAKRKLDKHKVIKIGITGSYGKTSTKNILATMLEKKFSVLATPKNYNTEMGVCKTILGSYAGEEVFIAEMGARKKGDIKKLADMVRPQYGIITTIGNQHLETFKTLENIEQTKFELAADKKRIMVFNGDSPSTLKLFDCYEGKKYLCNAEGGYVFAKNIKIGREGSSFDIVLDEKVYSAKTKLLGKININNIVTAACMAKVIGVTDEEILEAIGNLKPTKHRLEMIEGQSCTVIDDAYNSNVVGAREALEVLKCFEGQKIVITPGFVEMGDMQSSANFEFGCQIAEVADELIIMNEVNKNDILSGAISHNFPRKNIHYATSRKKQKEILEGIITAGAVVLFENDLPDNYK